MTDDEHVWRLPGTARGKDVRLGEDRGRVTGRSRGGPGHLKSHLDYITRNGRLQAETQDGHKITDRAGLRRLHDDWLLVNTLEQRGEPRPNAAQSVGIILSMPPGTPPD